jgi:hypothetical integral membrane protein (TIGR02206 family)
MNNYDVAILPTEMRYWIMMGCALFMGWVFIKSFDNISVENRNYYLKRLGFAIIAIQIFLPIYTVLNPYQTFSFHRSLPLHFCGLNFWLLALNCFIRNRQLFVYTFFMSILGGFYSLLTPLLTVGDSPFVMIHYILVHTGLFVVPIVMIRVYGMRLNSFDWLRAYLFAAVISTLMVFINGFINFFESSDGVLANYMFVSEAPDVYNPFLFPSLGWPLYLVPIHFALLLHMLVVNMIYRAREVGPIVDKLRIWQ